MNAYATYLERINRKRKVIATGDILNEKGVLIAKSGTPLNTAIYDKIIKFKLLKPLENSISIENQIGGKELYEKIKALIEEDQWLGEIHQQLGSEDILKNCCKIFNRYNILQQKMTVLSIEMPEVFNQSLVSAYFAMICMTLKEKSVLDITCSFLAGLAHDIGLLHIDRDIFTKKGALTSEQWRKVQSHPIIGYEILRRIPGINDIVTQAVLEHHESLNGTGYPRGRNQSQLGEMGQLISLLDNIIVIYNRKFKPLKRSIRDVLPVIQMSSHSYLPDVVSAVILLLRAASPSPVEEPHPLVTRSFTDFVHKQHQYIHQLLNLTKEANAELGFKHNDSKLYVVQNLSHNILITANRSGLDFIDHQEWDENNSSDDQAQNYREAEDLFLMLEEINYQLNTYIKSANLYVSSTSEASKESNILERTLKHINIEPKPPIPEALSDHWLLKTKK